MGGGAEICQGGQYCMAAGLGGGLQVGSRACRMRRGGEDLELGRCIYICVCLAKDCVREYLCIFTSFIP